MLPGFFTRQPPYEDWYMMRHVAFGWPPVLQVILDATAAARRVGPARPEIEFLHGWSAYHLQEWSAALRRLDADPSAMSTEWRMPLPEMGYWDRIDADDPVVGDALDRAAALAPDDPFFVEARRLVAARADLRDPDAMRRAFRLFDGGPGSCREPDCADWPGPPGGAVADAGVTPWRPWRTPASALRPLAEAPDGDGLARLFAFRCGRCRALALCDECSVTRRAVRLHRWTGSRLAAAPLEFLSSGSAADAVVAANNRAVALARARRWTEAVAVLDAARPLVGGHPVLRRNASLIDLNAAAGGGAPLSEDGLLHHVFAGSWADAVDRFRGAPAGSDPFGEPWPYFDEVARSENLSGAAPFLRAIFDATAAARAVGPARAEVEFLHAWSAFHLDPDTAVSPPHWSKARYRIDVDGAVLLETLDRAAALASGDALFAADRRAAAERMAR